MTQAVKELAAIVGDLNTHWKPHKAQAGILRRVFKEEQTSIFVECGRKFGKTELVSYFLWRMALLEPGGYYYMATEQKQAREILWAPRRIQLFGPQKYIANINNTEMRINFTNGSFIKIDGSDNYDSYRGVEPHGIAYDEFRDFRPEFHAAMGPNLGVYQAPLLITTTPPERDLEHYDAMVTEAKTGGNYFNYSTHENPHIADDWLNKEKVKLYARGEGDVWEREYMARKVRGGRNSIFPMFDPEKHIVKDAILTGMTGRDRHKMDWFVIADPATTSCFGVLVGAYHRYTKKVYIFREIYEKRQANTSTSMMIPAIEVKKEQAYPGHEAYKVDWTQVYDEAASWFMQEAVNSFDAAWNPTNKAARPKEQGLSAIKDLILAEHFLISDKCPNLANELINYIKDKNNKPVKENDHLIDCLRYAVDYFQIGLVIEKEPEQKRTRRFYTPQQDMAEAEGNDFDDFMTGELL